MGERRETQAQNVVQPSTAAVEAPLVRQACPECGGVMRLEQQGGTKEYICHVGHRLGLQSMIADKTDVVERSMWTALAQSEELIELLRQSEGSLDPAGPGTLQEEIATRLHDMETLRSVLERRRQASAGK